MVYGHEFLLSYVGTKATQKGRFDSESAYFSSNFLWRRRECRREESGERRNELVTAKWGGGLVIPNETFVVTSTE